MIRICLHSPACFFFPSWVLDHFFSFFLLAFFLFFLGPHLQHMEISRLEVELELQLRAYTMSSATWDPSHFCDLHHSSQQCRIPDPLSKARDRTCILTDTSQICFHCATTELPPGPFPFNSNTIHLNPCHVSAFSVPGTRLSAWGGDRNKSAWPCKPEKARLQRPYKTGCDMTQKRVVCPISPINSQVLSFQYSTLANVQVQGMVKAGCSSSFCQLTSSLAKFLGETMWLAQLGSEAHVALPLFYRRGCAHWHEKPHFLG